MSLQCAERVRPLLIEHDISVSTYDIDFAGHVSNIAYLRWLEDMRLKVFERHFPLESFMRQGLAPILVATNIAYKRPIRLFDKPRGLMWVAGVSRVTFTMEGEILVDGQLATSATHVGLFIDIATHKPVRLPAVCLEQFERSKG
jgi:acyl-CoA thioester hydrolase